MVIGTSVFSKVVTSHATCTSTCTRSIEQDSEHAALRFMQEHTSRFTILKQQRLTLVQRTCTCMTNRTRLLGFREERVNMERYKSNITFSMTQRRRDPTGFSVVDRGSRRKPQTSRAPTTAVTECSVVLVTSSGMRHTADFEFTASA